MSARAATRSDQTQTAEEGKQAESGGGKAAKTGLWYVARSP